MLGGNENKGKGCITKELKSDMTKFNPKGPSHGSVNDSPTRGSTPMVKKGKGSGKGGY